MKALRAIAMAGLLVCTLAGPSVAQIAVGYPDGGGNGNGNPKGTLPFPLPFFTTTTTVPTTTTLPPATPTTTLAPVVTTTQPPPPPTTTTIPSGPPRCIPGTSLGCADGNPCTIDVCDAFFRCVSTPADGARCDDGNPCTSDDRCQAGHCAGTPIDCHDGVDCTADRCWNGQCVHVPIDGRCDSGACRVSVCRPGDGAADAHGCVVVSAHPLRAGKADKKGYGKPNGGGNAKGGGDGGGNPPTAAGECTDDGFSCTDDVCGPAGCQHVPVDSRCVPADECTSAVCDPTDPLHDAAGCAPGPARAEGEECAEDGDACTVDVCRTGRCAHEPIHDSVTCAPVQGAFRQTIALDGLTKALMGDASVGGAALAARLTAVQSALDDAARVLAGKDTAAPAVAGGARLATFAPTPAQQRARIAFTMVLRTPRQVAAFLQTVALARSRAALGPTAAGDLRRRGRLLLRGTKTLKADLKRLQKVTTALAR